MIMSARFLTLWLAISVVGAGLWQARPVRGTEPAAPEPALEQAPVPKGVEVLTRGPVHEAFASPATEPEPTKPVPRKPPRPVEELPPDQKPEGGAIWISGYWAWDVERNDFLWVSGIWRVPPLGKRWVAGYWRAEGEQWQWVRGFWITGDRPADTALDTTYLPAPPVPPAVAPPGDPPAADSFYVPGNWVWQGDHYAWRSGYWGRVQPGYVWMPSHYCWTPSGYVFVAGYWDYALPARGVLYAPVYIDPVVVGPAFVFTPCYVVCDPFFCDWLFVGPCCGGYWFGDCCGPFWHRCGFESWAAFGHRHHDPLFAYARWEHRGEPHWEEARLDLERERAQGRAALPPRTLAEQTAGNRALAPAWQQAAARGTRMEPLDAAARAEWRQQGAAIRQAAAERGEVEVSGAHTPAGAPHVGRLPVAQQRTAPSMREAPPGYPAVRGMPIQGAWSSPWQGRPGSVGPGHTPGSGYGAHGHSSGSHGPSQR
jgi:hypothetical protein